MEKMIKKTIAILCIVTSVFAFSLNCYASDGKIVTNTNKVFVEEGVTEEGIHYRVYEIFDLDAAQPQIILYKKIKHFQVEYWGKIIPNDTYKYKDKEGYTGTLKLDDYYYDDFPINPTTIASYSGTVHKHD